MTVYCAKTADLIEVSFGVVDRVAPMNNLLDEATNSLRRLLRGKFCGGNGTVQRFYVKYSKNKIAQNYSEPCHT